MNIVPVKNWKYSLQLLETTSEEFKFLERFFFATTWKPYLYFSKNFCLYKVEEQNTKNETGNVKSNNLVLFHGTNKRAVAGI